MWLFTNWGVIHSGRVLGVRPPAYKDAKTLTLVVEPGFCTDNEASVTIADGLEFLKLDIEHMRDKAMRLCYAEQIDNTYLEAERKRNQPPPSAPPSLRPKVKAATVKKALKSRAKTE